MTRSAPRLAVAVAAGWLALTVIGRASAQESRPGGDKRPPAASPANAEIPPAEVSRPPAAVKGAPPKAPKGDEPEGRKSPLKPAADGRKAEAIESRPGVKAPALALTAGREAAARTFARLHHPELADLLERLQKADRAEYERAVRDLFAASEKLARVKERNPERYESALGLWKLDSRLRLLVARMTMTSDPALEAELSALLRERTDLRLGELRAEREKAATRVERLDEEIARIERNRDASLERELQQVRVHLSEQIKSVRKPVPKKTPEK